LSENHVVLIRFANLSDIGLSVNFQAFDTSSVFGLFENVYFTDYLLFAFFLGKAELTASRVYAVAERAAERGVYAAFKQHITKFVDRLSVRRNKSAFGNIIDGDKVDVGKSALHK
jgi:hypothetical protein